MKVNGEKVDSVTITGDNGVCIQVTDTGGGNLRVTEIGQHVKTLQVIPQSSNCVVISSTRNQY